MEKRLLACVAVLAAGTLVATPSTALAHGGSGGHHAPKVTLLTDQVGAPFNVVDTGRGLLIADGGPGQIDKLNHDGSVTPIITDAVGTSGVAVSDWGHLLAYTTTDGDENGITASGLEVRGPHGFSQSIDTLAYETANNPDQGVTYGIEHPTQCQIDAWDAEENGPINYTGGIDSHAYSVVDFGKGWVIADAGGNDLLGVDKHGNLRTIAVLPRQPLTITADLAAGLGLPDCFIGATYNFEPVPTDVEVGHDGTLYVTTLPGGPEDPSFPPRGSVYKVNPWNGHVKQLATGLAGATNLALGDHGEIYVAELFGGRISVVSRGHVKPYVDLPGAVAVESGRHGSLYAATLDLSGENPGTVVKISGKHGHHGWHHGHDGKKHKH